MEDYRRIVLDGVRYYGKHLILSARNCNEDIRSTSLVTQFIERIVPQINMVAHGAPIVERCGQGIEVGLSGVQLIETSAIVLHTNDMARDLYLDVFSCKGFNEEAVLELVDEAFHPQAINYQVLLRR